MKLGINTVSVTHLVNFAEEPLCASVGVVKRTSEHEDCESPLLIPEYVERLNSTP